MAEFSSPEAKKNPNQKLVSAGRTVIKSLGLFDIYHSDLSCPISLHPRDWLENWTVYYDIAQDREAKTNQSGKEIIFIMTILKTIWLLFHMPE